MEQGHKCVGERHSIIIDKQRLALSELRREIKKKSPSLPAGEIALKKIRRALN